MERPPQSSEQQIINHNRYLIFTSAGFVLVSQITLHIAPRKIHYLAVAGYTIGVTVATVGAGGTVYLVLLHCSAVMAGYFSPITVWTLVLLAMILQNSRHFATFLTALRVTDSEDNMYFPISGYLYCRSISVGLSLNDRLRKQRESSGPKEAQPHLLSYLRSHLPVALAYGFYLPWHYCGPILVFEDFCRQAEKPGRPAWSPKLLLQLVWKSLRLLLWMLVLQVFHHFLPAGGYLHSIQNFEFQLYKRLVFAMYLHGQNFMLEYVQLYGWPVVIAGLDGVQLLGWPDCISRVYTYRQMWRVFDRGLATFMHHHIYIPMGGSRRGLARRVAGVVASFAFVSIYHGDSDGIRLWCALNAAQLLMETTACALYEARIKRWMSVFLSPGNHQRAVAFLIGCNLILTSCFIFIFLVGSDTGLQLILEIFFKPLVAKRPMWHLLLLVYLSYCCVQVSLHYEWRTEDVHKEKHSRSTTEAKHEIKFRHRD